MSGQDIGSFQGICICGLDEDDSIDDAGVSIELQISISPGAFVNGLLEGLVSDDLSRLKKTSIGKKL